MTPEKIQIEVTIEGGFLHEGIKYSKGDISTELYAVGEYFCRAGWAKATDGSLAASTPNRSETVLLVQDVNTVLGVN